MSRRARLPGAAELVRTTSVAEHDERDHADLGAKGDTSILVRRVRES